MAILLGLIITLNYICFIYFTGNEVAGKITLKHVYEIAKVKSQDPVWENISMENICKSVIGSAHSIGVEVVKNYDIDEYREFLEERRITVKEQEDELEEQRLAKMMRLG